MKHATRERRPLATPDDLAEFLGVPRHTLDVWRSRGLGPAWSKVGRHVRYAWEDIEKWLAEQRREPVGA